MKTIFQVQCVVLVLLLIVSIGCKQPKKRSLRNSKSGNRATTKSYSGKNNQRNTSKKRVKKFGLLKERGTYQTQIVKKTSNGSKPVKPPKNSQFQLVSYKSPVGNLAAYITKDPGDGKRHPAIIWITGGDCNSISEVWKPMPKNNDQYVSPLPKAGIVTMFPSLRGGSNNPGRKEGFYGEVNDVIAAAKYLEKLPYVDPKQIYLGGHSTGGTLAMLVGESTDRFKGIISLGPVADARQYGGNFVFCDANDEEEMSLRSPVNWLHYVESPMLVIEGSRDGNWDGCIDIMQKQNTNPKIQFFEIYGKNHFTVITPVIKILAKQIKAGKLNVNSKTFRRL